MKINSQGKSPVCRLSPLSILAGELFRNHPPSMMEVGVMNKYLIMKNLLYFFPLILFFSLSCSNDLNNNSIACICKSEKQSQNEVIMRSNTNIGLVHNQCLDEILSQYNGNLWNADSIISKVRQCLNLDPIIVYNEIDYYYQFQDCLDSINAYTADSILSYCIRTYNLSINELFQNQLIGEEIKDHFLNLPSKIFDRSINWDRMKVELMNLCENEVESIIVENMLYIGAYSYSFWEFTYPSLVLGNQYLPKYENGLLSNDEILALGGPALDMAGGPWGAVKWARKNWKNVTSGAWTHEVPEEDFWDLCFTMVESSIEWSVGSGLAKKLNRRG